MRGHPKLAEVRDRKHMAAKGGALRTACAARRVPGHVTPTLAAAFLSMPSMVMEKMEWEREESWFIMVAPTERFLSPTCRGSTA